MPLLDLDWGGTYPRDQRAFLCRWAASVGDALNAQLPGDRFLAELAVRTRLKAEEQVGWFEDGPPTRWNPDGTETGERYASFAAPPPDYPAPARFIDRVGVDVIDRMEGPQIGAVVLFVCPHHKQDSDGALALATQVAAFLYRGTGVVVIDAVPGAPPGWATHLHSLAGVFPAARRPPGVTMAALAVRPAFRDGTASFDVWHHTLRPGDPLPVVPVPVRGAMFLRLDLEATYAEACERSRIP